MFGQSNYFRKVHKISHLILYIFRIVILIHNSYNLEIKKQNGDSYSLKQFFGLLIVFFLHCTSISMTKEIMTGTNVTTAHTDYETLQQFM